MQYFLRFALLFVIVGCSNVKNKIKSELSNVCDCTRIEMEETDRNEFTYITYNLYECKFTDELKEITRIMNQLQEQVPEMCSMEEKIVIQFVVNEGLRTRYLPHVYWKCTPQFEF